MGLKDLPIRFTASKSWVASSCLPPGWSNLSRSRLTKSAQSTRRKYQFCSRLQFLTRQGWIFPYAPRLSPGSASIRAWKGKPVQ